jgi:AcrR family transcriptional regulator
MMRRAHTYDRDTAIDAAMTLFWRKGYHATSLKDLEGALNMKPGSIYAAFDSKEALFGLSLQRYYERSLAGLRAALEGATSPLSALAGFLRKTAREPFDDPSRCACMLMKTVLNATPDEPQISERAGQYLDALRAEMARAFERAKALGELPPEVDPDNLARRFQADVMQLRIEAQRGLRGAELQALAEDMATDVEAMRTG